MPNLYDDTLLITPSPSGEIEEFMTFLSERLSSKVVKRVLLCFLSEKQGFERLVYDYLKLGLKKGVSFLNNLADNTVKDVNKLCAKVKRECHRFYGLLRFEKTSEGVYYATFEPDHNIIVLIAPHFKNRMRDQDWIIHDKRRDLAVLYSAKDRLFEQVAIERLQKNLSDDEAMVQQLWRAYFKSITIDDRKNPTLQRRFMPVRYWKYLTEKVKE